MSKAKKAAYAEKQRIAGAATAAQTMTPLAGGATVATAPAKKMKARKQSRGK